MLKKIFLFVVIVLALFIIYLIFNTLTFQSKQITDQTSNYSDDLQISPESKMNLSRAIRIKTVSPENTADFDSVQFRAFNAFLAETYPLAEATLEKKIFNEFSHLYKWEGSDKSLKPIALMGHIDVVPVIEENLSDWDNDPFGGEILNDTIWGRGAMDDKMGVIGIMESVELLLREGFKPSRTIYLAFGHDEEVGGNKGMKEITEYLKRESVEMEFVVDEGGSIASKLIPGIDKDVAMIGVAEKGFISLTLTINIEGGHSSTPEKETSIDVLAKAIVKLKENPFPPRISQPLEGFIDYLGPEMPFVQKMVFANSGVLKPLIFKIYAGGGATNAMIRTTTSPTIFNSGVKDNIIPQKAQATINFRIIPGETMESVISQVRKTIDDERISIQEGDFNSNPSSVSSNDSFGYKIIEKTISETYPDALISPFLVLGATDSRYFNDISDNILRFSAIRLREDNVKAFHGLNERLSIKDFENSIKFYHQLIRNSAE